MNLHHETAKQLAYSMAEKQDTTIRKAISAYIGSDDWNIDDVLDRINWQTQEGVPGKKLMMDGRMILELLPVEVSMDTTDQQHIIKAKQYYRSAA